MRYFVEHTSIFKNTGFIVEFTYYEIQPFKVYDSMALHISTKLYNHFQSQI